MPNPFELLVQNLNALGFFGFLLPWIFMFAVSFGLLVKSKVLGDDKRISAVVSLVLAFFIVGFGGPFLANFFVSAIGMAAVVLVGILVIILFINMAGIPVEDLAKNKAVLAALVGIGIIIFVVALGAWSTVANPTTIAIVLMIIIMALTFVFITK
jgi:hypothetical protein